MKSQVVKSFELANLNRIAAAYKETQEQIAELEKELEMLRSVLEKAALEKGLVLELSHYKVTLSPSEREVFALKDARQKLGDTILRPFMRLAKYNRLKVAANAA